MFAEKRVVEGGRSQARDGSRRGAALKPDAQLEDLEVDLGMKELGRIAAQTAKQVSFRGCAKPGQGIFSGTRIARGPSCGRLCTGSKRTVILDMGRTRPCCPSGADPGGGTWRGPRARLHHGSRNTPRALRSCSRVRTPDSSRVSSGRNRNRRGIVQVRGAARGRGSRPSSRSRRPSGTSTRSARASGCAGRGSRSSSRLRAKIDIIRWSDDPVTLVARALAGQGHLGHDRQGG